MGSSLARADMSVYSCLAADMGIGQARLVNDRFPTQLCVARRQRARYEPRCPVNQYPQYSLNQKISKSDRYPPSVRQVLARIALPGRYGVAGIVEMAVRMPYMISDSGTQEVVSCSAGYSYQYSCYGNNGKRTHYIPKKCVGCFLCIKLRRWPRHY